MFTGIITALGELEAHRSEGKAAEHGLRATVLTPPGYLNDTGIGDSIAVNGACMTVIELLDTPPTGFGFDISAESLNKTAGLDASGPVNLEKALRANDRLGGHLVSGHVDGTGTVQALEQRGESWTLTVFAPAALRRFLAVKGSLTVNGVSLTVNAVSDAVLGNGGEPVGGCAVQINLVPHTMASTTLGQLRPGHRVNLEIDMIARYVERMLATAGHGAAAAELSPARTT